MSWSSFKPKPFSAIDVDIKISHCGICGSDIHTLRSGWKSTRYPVCVGHEIVGHVVRVGDQVRHLKAGDRVGVGAQAFACLECEDCKAGLEQHCSRMVGTYNGKYPDGSFSMGGYADYARVPAHFGGQPAGYDSFPYAGTADAALAQLDDAYAGWTAGVRRLDVAALARPCGPAEGPFAEYPMAALVLHINREVIHHGAEVALPPTHSVDIAARRLAELPAGGRTPLAEGLLTAAEVLRVEKVRDPRRRPLLIVITDGRATHGADAVARSRQAAQWIAEHRTTAVVVDCEQGPMRMGLAGSLAQAMQATHLPIADVSASALTTLANAA